MKFEDIVKDAQQVRENVEKKQTASINKTRNYSTLAYLFSKSILNPGKSIGIKRVPENPKPQGTPVDGGIGKKNYLKLCELMVNWFEKHGEAPAYLPFDNGTRKIKIAIWVWTYATARIVLYYNVHKELPNKVLVTNVPFRKPEPIVIPKPKTTTEEVFDYFCKKFGKPSTIDGALSKIQGNGYGYYYDDKYSNKEAIDRMANGYGVNCTDSCHVFWHIGKALGYEVRGIHIYCLGGDGHIRLQFKHPVNTEGSWINRDPAAVLNGNDVSSIWCSSGTHIGTNPDWFLENLNK